MAVDGWISEKMGEFGRLAGRMTAYILHPTYIVPTYGAKATHVDHVPPGKQQLPVAEGPNTKGQILCKTDSHVCESSGSDKREIKNAALSSISHDMRKRVWLPLLLGFKTVCC